MFCWLRKIAEIYFELEVNEVVQVFARLAENIVIKRRSGIYSIRYLLDLYSN